MEDKIIQLGIETTTFVFGKTEDSVVHIFENCKTDQSFALLEIDIHKTMDVCRVSIYINDFNDWKPIHSLLRFGNVIVNAFPNLETVKIELCQEMEKEVIYNYRMTGRPFYAYFGYLPSFPYLCSKSKQDFYKMPFTKPDEFLQLENASKLVCPLKLITNKVEHPLLLTCQKDPSKWIIRLLPATSFYKSYRPITSMSLLRQSTYKILFNVNPPPNGIPFCHQGRYYIPVIRYAAGMSNGCYFDCDKESAKYLGTFYYWEPESNIYLKMGKKAFPYFYSKFECAIFIQSKIMDIIRDKDKIEDAQQVYQEIDFYVTKIRKDLRKALYKYYEEEAHLFEKCVCVDEWDDFFEDWEDATEFALDADFQRILLNQEPKFLPITLDFRSKVSFKYMNKLFYASEDELDQPLSKGLIFLGLKGAIFSKMAGGNRVVTEVLDVRARQKSLENLCWTVM